MHSDSSPMGSITPAMSSESSTGLSFPLFECCLLINGVPGTPIKHAASLSVGLKQEKAHFFFSHYLVVRPHLAENTLSKSIVYALYRHMMLDEFRYDFANFSNALYDWAYLELVKVCGGRYTFVYLSRV